MLKLGLVSDVHAQPEPLRRALEIFRQRQVDHILCAGDIAGYGEKLSETVDLLQRHRVISIRGNHDNWLIRSDQARRFPQAASYLARLPIKYSLQEADRDLLMVHAQPPSGDRGGIKLLDKQGHLCTEQIKYWEKQLQGFAYSMLIVGHTHQVFAEMIGQTLVVNPGSCCFNHSCALVSLAQMSVEFIALSDKGISHTWNWGQQFSDNTGVGVAG